jgi:hypothetical protein
MSDRVFAENFVIVVEPHDRGGWGLIPNMGLVMECRPHQRALFDYFNGIDGRETFHNKRAIVFAHRRWGKDSVAVNLMAMSAMRSGQAIMPTCSHCRRRRGRPYGRTLTVPVVARSWISPSRMRSVSASTTFRLPTKSTLYRT